MAVGFNRHFDQYGREVFDNFVNVKKSIAGTPVDDICFFNSLGHMYQDVLTYGMNGDPNLYYINPYGVMERKGWFRFSNGDVGYANLDGHLMTNQYTYYNGKLVYLQGNGHGIVFW